MSCQLLKLNQTKIGEGFEQTYHVPHGCQDVLHTYVKVHRCPPPFSNSIGVKKSQVLTHAIVLAPQFDV
jgi:hypothetical protein